jgi:hypothetical protein
MPPDDTATDSQCAGLFAEIANVVFRKVPSGTLAGPPPALAESSWRRLPREAFALVRGRAGLTAERARSFGDVDDGPNHSCAGLDGVRPYLGGDRRQQGEKLPVVRAARRARTDHGRLCDLHAPEGPLPGLPRKSLARGKTLPVFDVAPKFYPFGSSL